MAAFDYPIHIERDYRARLKRRVEAARQTIEDAFEKLKRAERRDPSVWDGLLRDAERAYHDAFDESENRRLAEEFVERIRAYNEREWRRNHPDLADENPEAFNLSPDTIRERLHAQLDSMKVLIDRYYARLRDDVETDDQGLIVVAAIGAVVAKEAGIRRREADFFARDQTGTTNETIAGRYMKNMGVERYEWLRTTADNPRERHLGRVGNIYSMDDPPNGGHPGSEPNCQCGMRPIRDS